MNEKVEHVPCEQPEPRKKPYQPPALIRLGSLSDLTRKVGWRGRSDGGRFPRGFRTSF
ncbi:MAG: lasso RiPP family leader peptide-containing protein [Reyranella sp.]